jgi:hypothetical protein
MNRGPDESQRICTGEEPSVFRRIRLARGTDGLVVSPILLGTILVALVSTAVLIAAWYMDVTAPVAPAGSGLAPHRANLIVAVGVSCLAWAAVFFAICFDLLLRRIEDLTERLDQARSEVTEQFAREARELIARAGELGVLHGLDLSEEEQEPRPAQQERLATSRQSRTEVPPPRRPFRVQ